MANKIEFIVLGDTKDLESKLSGVKKSFDAISKVSAIALAGLVGETFAAIDAAREQELAVNQLNQALKNQGNFTQDASKDLVKYADDLQQITLFNDEAIISAQALIASFGFEGQTLKDLTKATLNLAQAKGIDLASAGDIVAKSVGGTTNVLGRYGIAVEGVAGSTERAKSAIEGINRLYGGQAEAATQGLGATVQLKKAINELQESIGQALAPTVLEMTAKLKSFVDEAKNNPGLVKLTADIIILGIQVSALTLAFGLLGRTAAVLTPVLAFLSGNLIQIGSRVFLITELLLPLAAIGAAAFVGWKVGELVSDVTGLSEAIRQVGTAIGELNAQRQLGADYVSEEEFAYQKEKEHWTERAAAKQAEIAASQAAAGQHLTEYQQKLATMTAFQAQAQALDDAALVAEMNRIKVDSDLNNSAEQQKTTILQNEMKKRAALRDADKNSQLAALDFVSQMVTLFGNESKAAFYILKAVKAAEVLVNMAAADMAIESVWAWNPPVALALQAKNHVLAGFSLATIAASAIAGSFATGSGSIPNDMVAEVHKKEIIVPANFSDAIRSGQLALSGPGQQQSGGDGSRIVFDFTGAYFNAITDDLVQNIFTKASENIRNRTMSALPAAA